MSILLKDLPKEDLPRERLKRYGAKSLSNEELLTILISTGTKNKSAKDLAYSILSRVENIRDLKDANTQKLSTIKGIGFAKSTTLLAALELGRRVYDMAVPANDIKIMNACDAYTYFGKEIAYESQEHFMVIYLDNASKYISHRVLFKGTINQSIISPREVIKTALELNSNKIILMHNHPSGSLIPSKSDDAVTESIASSANLLEIKVLDHLIVSPIDYYSYCESGALVYE